MKLNGITSAIIGPAIKVHKTLSPGLIEAEDEQVPGRIDRREREEKGLKRTWKKLETNGFSRNK